MDLLRIFRYIKAQKIHAGDNDENAVMLCDREGGVGGGECKWGMKGFGSGP